VRLVAPDAEPTTGVLLRGVFAAGTALLAGAVVLVALRAVLGAGGGDLWSFWAAGRALDRGLDPYNLHVLLLTPTPSDVGRAPFLSPPFLAEAMRLLGLLPFRLAYAVWAAVSLLCGVAAAAALLHVARIPSTAANLCCAAVVGVLYAPLMRTIALGQTDLLVVACLAGSWWLRMRARPFTAGLLACGSLVDPHLAAAFLLYYGYLGVFRRQRHLLGGVLVGLAATVACSAMHPAYAVEWLRVVLPRAQTDVLGMANQVTTLRLLRAVLPQAPALAVALAGILDAGALALACTTWSRQSEAWDRGMAVAAALALLTASFAYLPDYLLLFLAAPAAVNLWRGRAQWRPWAPLVLGCLGVTYAAIDAMLLTTARSVALPVAVGPLVVAVVLAIRAIAAGWEPRSDGVVDARGRRVWMWAAVLWLGATVAVSAVAADSHQTVAAAAVALTGTAGAMAGLWWATGERPAPAMEGDRQGPGDGAMDSSAL